MNIQSKTKSTKVKFKQDQCLCPSTEVVIETIEKINKKMDDLFKCCSEITKKYNSKI